MWASMLRASGAGVGSSFQTDYASGAGMGAGHVLGTGLGVHQARSVAWARILACIGRKHGISVLKDAASERLGASCSKTNWSLLFN